MKIETQPREDHQVQLVVELEPEVFEQSRRKAARKIAKEAKIPGFRPGKAPFEVVRRTFGDDLIRKEAIEISLDEIYPEALKQAAIEPGAMGTLEKVANTEPVIFTFLVPLKPTVDLGAYREVRLPYEPKPIGEREVDDFIYQLQLSSATAEPADDRPAQEGDMVYLSISGGFVTSGKGKAKAKTSEKESGNESEKETEKEGADKVAFKETSLQVMIREAGKSAGDEYPYEGFNQDLIGVRSGEEKKIVHTFPKKGNLDPDLDGKKVEFTVKAQSIKAMKLPELNAEFAQNMGEFESMDALRETALKQMEVSRREEYDDDFMSKVLEEIKTGAVIKYPPQVLREEMDGMVESLERDLARQKLDLDTYLKVQGKDKEKFLEENVAPPAKLRLERSLILEEIARQEKIELDNAELEKEFSQALYEMSIQEGFSTLKKKLNPQRLANAVAMQAANRLMNRQVFDRIKTIATGQLVVEEKPAEAEEAEKPKKAKSAKAGAKAAKPAKPAKAEKAPAKNAAAEPAKAKKTPKAPKAPKAKEVKK